jgi:hypothetical protein
MSQRYIVLTGTTPIELQCAVERHLGEGWVPWGGVSVTSHGSGDRDGYSETYFEYAQAMVPLGLFT